MNRKLVVLALTATAVLPAAAAAPAAGPYGKRVARDSDAGRNASASVAAKANRPRRIRLQIAADPEQRVSVSWSMTCQKGARVGSASGDFSDRAPVVRKLGLPFGSPGSCQVSATGRLAGTGRIVLTLYNEKRE
jgi:hypothetical protein